MLELYKDFERNDYRELYINGQLNKSEYDDCRFADDKEAYAREWILSKQPNTSIDDPKNIVDLICHEKIRLINATYSELHEKQVWSDKIAVYDELDKLGLNDIALPCVFKGYMTSVDDNIFEYMNDGEQYIIKTNHGSGWNIKYQKGVSNEEYVLSKLNEWLSMNYAYISGYELQYKFIKPGIVIQKVLVDKPLDWSFWCIDGNIEGIGITRKVGKNFEEYIAFTDKDGNKKDWFIGFTPEMKFLNRKQKDVIEKMKPFVERLANGHKFVRIDMYYIGDKVYFGEKTFTPCSGILDQISW